MYHMPTIILFIIGRPGSGKTTAVDYITSLAKSHQKSVFVINDYNILHQMSLLDTEHLRFISTEFDGFDVIDFLVLDEVLQNLEHNARLQNSCDLVTIEFARNEYRRPISFFSNDFVEESFFLYVDVNTETCLTRIHERVINSNKAGDHPSLSDKKFREYYGANGKQYITTQFKADYALKDEQIVIIRNERTKEEFLQEIEQYFKDIILKAIESD
jgi:uridine kinase